MKEKTDNLAVKRRKEPSVIQSQTYITRLLPVRKHHFLEVILTVQYQRPYNPIQLLSGHFPMLLFASECRVRCTRTNGL